MTVLVAHDTPPAIRGMLKRWFIELKPNVFVGTVNRRTRDKVLDYVKRNAEGMSLLILTSEPNCKASRLNVGANLTAATPTSAVFGWLPKNGWIKKIVLSDSPNKLVNDPVTCSCFRVLPTRVGRVRAV